MFPHGPAWAIGITTEQPLIGDSTVFREQRFYVHKAQGWEVSDIFLSRYGDIALTVRHADSADSCELSIRLGDSEAAKSELAYGLVRLIGRLGDSCRPDAITDAEALLDRIEGACEGARAEIASTRAAQAAQEVAR